MNAQRGPKTRWTLIVVGIWLALVGAGMAWLTAYSFTPGEKALAPARWPLELELPFDKERHNLVVVAHPKCSCTRATIAEFAELMAGLAGRVQATVLFVRPDDYHDDWAQTDLYRSASLVPDTRVVIDSGGASALVLGARTSGQVYLFAPTGERLFAGGITPTRSHQGDNVGSRRIAELVRGGRTDRDESAVFGCPLVEETSLSRYRGAPTHACPPGEENVDGCTI